MKTKLCPDCKVVKSVTEYYSNRRAPNGLGSYCKTCCARKDRTPKARYSQTRCVAKRRNIEWKITLQEFETLISGNACRYCSGPLGETGAGLDRIDSKAPYTASNCVPCCPICNVVRHNTFTCDEMIVIGKAVQMVRMTRPKDNPILLAGQKDRTRKTRDRRVN